MHFRDPKAAVSGGFASKSENPPGKPNQEVPSVLRSQLRLREAEQVAHEQVQGAAWTRDAALAVLEAVRKRRTAALRLA